MHVSQFCNIYLVGKETKIGFQVLWLACCWSLRKEKSNNRLFAHKTLFVIALVENVKIVSWWWLKTRKHDLIVISTCDDQIL
jgi:hypothetical protein